MDSNLEKTVAGIKLHRDRPTDVALHRLHGWVIWQFPQPQKRGYLGAIRPALPGHEWIPALIRADRNSVKVFGNAPSNFTTPEEAADYLAEQ